MVWYDRVDAISSAVPFELFLRFVVVVFSLINNAVISILYMAPSLRFFFFFFLSLFFFYL